MFLSQNIKKSHSILLFQCVWQKQRSQDSWETVDEKSVLRPGGGGRWRQAVQDETSEKMGLESIKDFLSEQDAHTSHKPTWTHFTRNRVFVPRPMDQFQTNLCDMQALAEHSDGFKYFPERLTCVFWRTRLPRRWWGLLNPFLLRVRHQKSYKWMPVKNFLTRVSRLRWRNTVSYILPQSAIRRPWWLKDLTAP